MSKDYKSMDRKLRHRDNGGSMFIGILIGLVLGLAIALGVAWYINKMPSPFQQRDKNAKLRNCEDNSALPQSCCPPTLIPKP